MKSRKNEGYVMKSERCFLCYIIKLITISVRIGGRIKDEM